MKEYMTSGERVHAALNPVQITGEGQDPEFMKDVYGKELVFWGGGIDSQCRNLQTGWGICL